MSAPNPSAMHAGAVYVIDGPLTVYSVSAQRTRLLEFLKNTADPGESAADAPVQIDLSQVTDCDCAGLQLLLALSRSCHEAGRPLRLLHTPDSINEKAAAAAITLP